MKSNYWTRQPQSRWQSRFSRRKALAGAGGLGVGIAGVGLVGCGDDDDATNGDNGTNGTNGETPGTTPDANGNGNGNGNGTATRGGTFVQPALSTYEQHDPHTALGPNVWHVLGERAFEQHSVSGELLPSLVESYEVEDDGLTYIMHVRPNVGMHNREPVNGRNFDAEDLVFNLRRANGDFADDEGIPLASFQRRSLLGGMESAEAVDEATVRVTMSRPNSSFLNGLSENRMMMFPREIIDVGFDDPTQFAGPGAFEMDEFERGEIMSYRRFDNYFMEGRPYFDAYEQIIVADRSAMIAAFISGEISQLTALQSHEVAALEAAVSGAQIYEGADANQMQFRPNMNHEPFQDFRVRKALQLSLDYQGMADGFWGGGWDYMAAFHSSFPEAWSSDEVSQLPGYNPDTTEDDRAEAVQMLDAAGYPEGAGIQFEMLCVEAIPDTVENAIRMQDQWQTAFPQMSVSVRPYPDLAAYSRPQSDGDFEAVSYIITAVPDAVLEAITQNHSDGSRNYGGFANEELDTILNQAEAELDFEARSSLLEEFQQKYMDEWQPIIWLYVRPQRVILQPEISGYADTFGPWLGYGNITEVKHWSMTS